MRKVGIILLRAKKLDELYEAKTYRNRLDKVLNIIGIYGIQPGVDLRNFANHSRAQLAQDLWVILASGAKRNGTFLEIGGADGLTCSNTYLLEKELDWTGVLVEPALIYRESLKSNRKCGLDFRCCTSQSGEEIQFSETISPMLSTISSYRFSDLHAAERVSKVKTYLVETVSLNDLFKKYFPLGRVDYLSIDTEGSEEDILKTFDFERYSFSFLTIENAFNSEKSERISQILIPKGYRRVLQELSEFDDWYVKL